VTCTLLAACLGAAWAVPGQGLTVGGLNAGKLGGNQNNIGGINNNIGGGLSTGLQGGLNTGLQGGLQGGVGVGVDQFGSAIGGYAATGGIQVGQAQVKGMLGALAPVLHYSLLIWNLLPSIELSS
jgi:hypothetical protein